MGHTISWRQESAIQINEIIQKIGTRIGATSVLVALLESVCPEWH